jgi:hypothetical protein
MMRSSPASQCDSVFSIGALFNRALTEKEQLSLSTNPYQLLKPANQPLYFTQAGAAPAFKAYWAHQANTLIQGGM